jgi:hypothetical protein
LPDGQYRYGTKRRYPSRCIAGQTHWCRSEFSRNMWQLTGRRHLVGVSEVCVQSLGGACYTCSASRRLTTSLDARRAAAGIPPLSQYACLLEEAGMRVDRSPLPPGFRP